MSDIHAWLRERLIGGYPIEIIECGAHRGEDTLRLAALPRAHVTCFEPDPRNDVPEAPNVDLVRAAVGACVGLAPFYPSQARGDVPWTCSGSLRVPSKHLEAYPDVTFGPTIQVPVFTLDGWLAKHRPDLAVVDLLWLDVQGAEVDVIAGAKATLSRTRYLYTEVCDDALYRGQAPADVLLDLLTANGFDEVRRWRYPGEAYCDVLLARRLP